MGQFHDNLHKRDKEILLKFILRWKGNTGLDNSLGPYNDGRRGPSIVRKEVANNNLIFIKLSNLNSYTEVSREGHR